MPRTGQVQPPWRHNIGERQIEISPEYPANLGWFEDAPGLIHTGRSDRDFNDIVISVTGGIDNGKVADLLQIIQTETGQAREQALATLKKINPKAAAGLAAAKSEPAN